ncbi:MAG TPA: DUF3618 domain-containing protein [Kofleriaceae bacterium]|nr:DUF3618 domain-containing protein [Kofleriaceae bacterium]
MPGTTEDRSENTRNPEEIQREIEHRREDLAANISALGDEVRGKLDVKQRARDAMSRGKERARDAMSRGKDRARDVMSRGRERARYGIDRGSVIARTHPEVVGAVAGGLVATGLVLLARRRARHRLH